MGADAIYSSTPPVQRTSAIATHGGLPQQTFACLTGTRANPGKADPRKTKKACHSDPARSVGRNLPTLLSQSLLRNVAVIDWSLWADPSSQKPFVGMTWVLVGLAQQIFACLTETRANPGKINPQKTNRACHSDPAQSAGRNLPTPLSQSLLRNVAVIDWSLWADPSRPSKEFLLTLSATSRVNKYRSFSELLRGREGFSPYILDGLSG